MLFKRKKPVTSAYDHLIVGLGNPGSKYDLTRHNIGFISVDKMAEEKGFKINKLKYKSLLGECTINGFRCLVMKPQTFMNNSGEAVGECASFYKIPCENILVICDDISLEVGELRIRRKGSHGGHNGIKSIIQHMNSDAFPRIKIGVGSKPHPDYDLASWVLSIFTEKEQKELTSFLPDIINAVELIVKGETDSAMNKYNS